MRKLLLPILSLTSIIALAALPVQAQNYYLFAGDRVPNPARDSSLHRYAFDPKAPAILTPAPGGGLGNALLGSTDNDEYKGLDFSGVVLASNGDFYAVSNSNNKVFRLDGKTGAIKKVVLSGLNGADGITIGPDGNLYIANATEILRCTLEGEPRPGAEQLGNVFTRGGDLSTASGLTFGPDGNLYVASQNWRRILRYSGHSGQFMDVFHSGEINTPGNIAFGPDGNLYVACISGATFTPDSGYIAQLDGKTGDKISNFAPDAKGAMGLAFGPNGNLFVSSYWTGEITQFDGKTGASLGMVAKNPDGSAFNSVLFADAGATPDGSIKPFTLTPLTK